MTWRRLEATSVDAALVESTEARVADPYWLLGKQWQVGELTGDDAASPVLVECDVSYTPVTRFQAGPPESHGPVIDRAALGVPLETAVEREDVRDGPAAARLSAEAGLQLLRLLEAAGAPATARAALRAAFPLRLPDDDGLDPLGRAQLKLLARRSFDSAALAQRLAGGGPAVPGLDRPALRSAVTAWSSWYASLFSEPPSGTVSWQPERMGYRFRVAASPQKQGEVLLDAAEYDGGSLDWYAFDVREDLPALGAPAAIEQRHVRVAPTPARYAGQAASRWWQVEDADVWFGDLHTGSTDLARAAVGVYGASFGDDWLLVPVRLPAGVLARVDTLTVHDTFGETHRIRSCAELDGPGRVWRYFELTGDASADADNLKGRTCPWLFLPPVLPGITESRPLEEVVFLRDEGANLGWAAELRVESQAGRPIDRAALARAARQPSPTAVEGAWLYLLSTPVLDHQIPLVPVRLPDGSLSLQRGRVATGVAGAEVTTRGALGRILEPGEVLLVDDGEVPATGMRVTRTWQVARTADGGIVCWVGRRKTPAPPRHAAGLVFDQVRQ